MYVSLLLLFICREECEPRESFISVYKLRPDEKLSCRYPLIVVHDILNKILATSEKYPLTNCEFRIFTSSRDHDDFLNQEGECRSKSTKVVSISLISKRYEISCELASNFSL